MAVNGAGTGHESWLLVESSRGAMTKRWRGTRNKRTAIRFSGTSDEQFEARDFQSKDQQGMHSDLTGLLYMRP